MSGNGQYVSGGANAYQKGRAAELRNGGQRVSSSDKQAMNQIVHSGDTTGKYKDTQNNYRDPTNSYDPKAQAVLNRYKK